MKIEISSKQDNVIIPMKQPRGLLDRLMLTLNI